MSYLWAKYEGSHFLDHVPPLTRSRKQGALKRLLKNSLELSLRLGYQWYFLNGKKKGPLVILHKINDKKGSSNHVYNIASRATQSNSVYVSVLQISIVHSDCASKSLCQNFFSLKFFRFKIVKYETRAFKRKIEIKPIPISFISLTANNHFWYCCPLFASAFMHNSTGYVTRWLKKA